MNTENNILADEKENDNSKQSLKQTSGELEKVVAALEKGDVSLDEMLTLLKKA